MKKSGIVKIICEPLKFCHVYSSAPWGGGWLKTLFARTDAPEVCSESWEISGHPHGMSVVDGGSYDGRTLASLVKEFGASLVGSAAPDSTRFPLLIKLLDARRSLSVQVHPNAKTAKALGGEPKTEAWVVLEASPGAALYAGVERGVTAVDLENAAKHGEAVLGTLKKHNVRPGDVVFVPGGTVHAIGAGCLVYEVQQSSDSTYRLYDWDRGDGKLRPLHIPQAIKALDRSMPVAKVHRCGSSLVRSRQFKIVRSQLKSERKFRLDGRTFLSVFVLDGGIRITSGGVSIDVMRGNSALVPASAGFCIMKPHTVNTKLILTTLV